MTITTSTLVAEHKVQGFALAARNMWRYMPSKAVFVDDFQCVSAAKVDLAW